MSDRPGSRGAAATASAALLSLILVAVCTAGLMVSTSTAARAQSYPFTCRIGQQNRPLTLTGAQNVTVAFFVSNGPVASGLNDGQCAFADRAVKASEPRLLCGSFNLDNFQIKNGTTISELSATGPGGTLLLTALFGPTKLMNFTVHNSGLCMVIDSYGV